MSYSIVCKRCGRRLTSEESRRRGYGAYCYRKIASDEKRDNPNIEKSDSIEIQGQMNIDTALKQVSGI